MKTTLALLATSAIALTACAAPAEYQDMRSPMARAAMDQNPATMPAPPMGAPMPPPSGMGAAAAREAPPPFPPEPGDDPTAPRADADMQRVLDALAALGPQPIERLSPAVARQQPTPADAVKKVLADTGRSTAPMPGVTVQNVTYPGAAGPVPARIYRPDGVTGPLPIIVYIHGGGWVIANLDVYDASPRALAMSNRALVVSISYRQAPEHKFPAAHDDVNAAYRWLLDNAQRWGGDARRIALVGESAGGNLAANISIYARDQGLQAPVHQVLVYPLAGTDPNTPSFKRNAAAKPLNTPMVKWFTHYVTRGPADAQDPRINLLAANLRGLPPTTVIGAEIDPLTSEGEQLTERLRAAGVAVERRQYDGVTHEFFGMGPVVSDAAAAQAYATARMRSALAAPPRR